VKKIAVLDDDPALVDLYSTILQEEDYEVIPIPLSTDINLVVDNIQRLHSELLILDIRLPGISCLEVIQALQPAEGGTPLQIMICSAAHNEIIELKRKLNEASLPIPSIIEKPFELNNFVVLVERLTNLPQP
jgi:DNA-binding response OmpR family regulator